MTYDISADTRSLYIHWPFCPYRCHFCPFVALSGHDHLMGQYHIALMREISLFGQKQLHKNFLETVYIGGGTPSTWPDELLLDMSGTLRDTFDCTQISEITLETNPGTVRKEQIAIWKEAGITRLSIGVQSLDDEVLKKLNRHQKVGDVYQLLEWAAGKFNLSIDLIIGLPGVTDEQWKTMVYEIMRWPVGHISMYFLSIHENTPLYTRLLKNELTLPPQDPLVDLYYWTVKTFDTYGFAQYEVSSFARSGQQAQHNQVYWERKPYKGFGIGACSFDGKVRLQNKSNIMRYMEAMEKGESVVSFEELLTTEQICLETVMLGLRRVSGVVINDVINYLSDTQKDRFLENVEQFKKSGIIESDGQKIYLARSSFAVENEVAVRLLQ